MNKIKYILSTLFLLIGLNATNAYVHFNKGQITNLQDGDTIAIKGAVTYGSDPQTYFAATGVSPSISDSALYVAVKADEPVNGGEAWYLKNVSRDAYVAYDYPSDEMGAWLAFNYRKNKIDAAPFWINIADTTAAAEGTAAYYVQKSYNYSACNESTVTITYARDISAYGEDAFWWMSNIFGGDSPQLSTYGDTNVCNLYSTTSLIDASTSLYDLLTVFGDGIETRYTAGEAVGNVPQEYVTALETAFQNAQTAYAGEDHQEQLDAYDALMLADENCNSNMIMLTDGYYSFEGLNDNAPRRAVMYVDGTNVMWEQVAADSTISDPKHIWKLTKRRTVNGVDQFDMMNVLTGYYMTGSETSSNVTVSADTTENAMIFNPSEMGGYFYLKCSNNATNDYGNLHVGGHGGTGSNVVLWAEAEGSMWFIRTIDQSVVDAMNDKVVQTQMNNKLQSLFDKAQSKMEMSRSYSLPEGVEANLTYTQDGLVTEESQLWSNADHNKITGTNDGNGIPALLNNVVGLTGEDADWFHSAWGAGGIVGYHNLQMNLGKKVSCVAFKMSPRKPNSVNAPTAITVYACNDTTGGTQWQEVGALTSLFKASTDSVILTSRVELGGEYQYIRLDVTATINNATNNGVPFFTLSEFRVYESAYEADQSQFEVIPNHAELAAAVAAARVELADNKATQATIDELQSQYDAFVEVLADPTDFNEKVALAQEYVDNAVIGEEAGYTPNQTVIDALQTAITTISATVNSQSNKEELQTGIENIDAAIATYAAGLNQLPTNTMLYMQSNSNGNGLYIKTSKLGFNTRWSGKDAADDGTLDDALINKPLYMFEIKTSNEADSVYIQNVGTGAYLTENAGLTYEPTCLAIKASTTPGIYNIVLSMDEDGNPSYLSVETSSEGIEGNVAVTSTASSTGEDAAGWKFVGLGLSESGIENNTYNHSVTPKTIQFITLPFNCTDYSFIGTLYQVKGIYNNGSSKELVLTELDPSSELVPAGTPMVIDMRDAEETDDFESFYTDGVLADSALTVNGVVGFFASEILPEEGAGYLEDSKVVVTTAEEAIRLDPFTAYMNVNVPAVDALEDGDITLPIEGTLTGIENTKIVNSTSTVNVYTAEGILVRKNVNAATATKNLPKGIYIVGSEKVLVK